MKDSLVAEKNFASCLKGKSSTQKSRREFAKLKGVQTWRDLIFMLIMLVESCRITVHTNFSVCKGKQDLTLI